MANVTGASEWTEWKRENIGTCTPSESPTTSPPSSIAPTAASGGETSGDIGEAVGGGTGSEGGGLGVRNFEELQATLNVSLTPGLEINILDNIIFSSTISITGARYASCCQELPTLVPFANHNRVLKPLFQPSTSRTEM